MKKQYNKKTNDASIKIFIHKKNKMGAANGEKIIISCKYGSIQILDVRTKPSKHFIFDNSNIKNNYYNNDQPYILLLKNKDNVGLATFENGVTTPFHYKTISMIDDRCYSNHCISHRWNFYKNRFYEIYFNNDKPCLVLLFNKKIDLCRNRKIFTDKIYENFCVTYRTFHGIPPFI